ncbi:MAG: 5-methyltetrahydropteroyltriglutamate--homocysteine S-methyltransferase [Alphaproteobacteria bacterium]|nr:5-methyltetrahydropteroyltriglutamate--homocysteine S-methyltransferase [Alphaproteobacteria bacterium]
MALATNLGFPRIGDMRQLKKAVEGYWKGTLAQGELLEQAKDLRKHNWQAQEKAGLDHIPSNDFSLYDHVSGLTATLGLVPKRYGWDGSTVDLDTYFAMARGAQHGGLDVTAMEMTKWFDTNYHYIVPEFEEGMTPKLSCNKIFDYYQEAKDLGIQTRPVIIGPATYVFLGKAQYDGFSHEDMVKKLIPVYNEILQKLSDMGAEWVQIDEPIFSLDLCSIGQSAVNAAYNNGATSINKPEGLKLLITSYFDTLRGNADLFYNLPVDAVHIDLCRGPNQANTGANNAQLTLNEALEKIGDDKILSLGIIDGRNIWRNNLSASLEMLEKAVGKLGTDRIFVAPSCSLLHTPVDLNSETQMEEDLKSWMAFAMQKIEEISTLTKGLNDGRVSIEEQISYSDAIQEQRRTSTHIHCDAVKQRVASITPEMKCRKAPFAEREKLQRKAIDLPLYPTTSIGSFPQTPEIRKIRAARKKGKVSDADYKDAIQAEIRSVIKFQHEIDIDILVHGEAERNDMVEYFGEQLDGFAFTKFGWVQSYGSRCVKPPIIYGDVSRPKAMTVEWSEYAQSQTDKVMKGMLTGPVTILQWSFVRDDQPRSATSRQIALAIRDEVADLESAGIRIIQIDEAAFREGLPLRKNDWKAYLDRAVKDFHVTSCCVNNETQIHTHMCYSEFNDIIESIAAMDADVISIETSRSQMELLDVFVAFKYPNEIGPGVYDIHSPRVPSVEEMVDLLEKAKDVLEERQIWVNPDCGLKTRGWAEVKPALTNMVKAAKIMRERACTVESPDLA